MKILIIGHKGQDGTFLTQYLEKLNHQVSGIDMNEAYQTSPFNIIIKEDVRRHLSQNKYDHIYFFASAQISSEEESTFNDQYMNVNVNSLTYFLDGIKEYSPDTKVFYANSVFIFGEVTQNNLLNEKSEMAPVCHYGISKFKAHQIIQEYRNQYGLNITNGILFNHESHLRKPNFLTGKLLNCAYTNAILKHSSKVEVSSLKHKVDFGHVNDFIQIFFKLMENNCHQDYIIATGELIQIKEYAQQIFSYFNLNYEEYINVSQKNTPGPHRGILQADITKLQNALTDKSHFTLYEQWIPQMCKQYIQMRKSYEKN